MGDSFWDAKPVAKSKGANTSRSLPGAPSGDQSISDDLSLYEVQRLLFDVQSRQEEAVLNHGALIDEYIEAEANWKAHESRILIGIRDRLARQDPNDKNKEKSSQDLREAEVMNSVDETGEHTGRELYRRYRLYEERVKQADRFCKTLDARGRFLQSLAANLREVG